MSLNFSANQYDGGYKPGRLANWEVGRTFQERPRQRRGATKVIADDRGHLLPGVPRTNASPWGPLTQAIDPNVNDRGRKYPENRSSPPPPEEDPLPQEESGGEDGGVLKITGSGFLGAAPRGADGLEEEGEGEDQHGTPNPPIMSGSITPATFRRQMKSHNPGNSIRSSRRSSRSSSSSTSVETRILREVANLPADTVEDALLPRRPEEELVELTGSRAMAIRLVDHPAPTNCTKYTVLRPNTAPTPAPSTKAPLLPKRPKTAKILRKVPEIEFALKWDLKENDIMEEDEEEEAIEVVSLKKSKQKEPPSPRSVSSADSGIHIPKTAWNDGPDTRELTTKLEHLKKSEVFSSKSISPSGKRREPESGYGTPVSRGSQGSLPLVASRASSGRASVKLALKTTKTPTPEANGSGAKVSSSRRISMDSQKLAQESPKSATRSRATTPSARSHPSKSSSKEASRSGSGSKTQSSTKESKPLTPRPQVVKPSKYRDPLEIMETMDSVFHTVPLRETGQGYTYRSDVGEKQHAAAATQTEEQNGEFAGRRGEDDVNGASDAKVRHNHPGHIRSRNCLACEMRAMEEPPKKFQGPSDYKPAFKAGKPHPSTNGKQPKYLRQSEKYNARLRPRHEGPRHWPINTLSAPFCNRPGYGQDQYPDHMRLRSTYGMAYVPSGKPVHASLINKLYL